MRKKPARDVRRAIQGRRGGAARPDVSRLRAAAKAEAADVPERRALWILAAILVGGAAWRFWGLGGASLWIDEAHSWWASRLPVAQLVTQNIDHGNPPLYYILLGLWMRLFGDSEAAGRSLSALMGTGSVGVLYLLGRELFSRRVGLLAALLMAASPLHRWYSQEARAYMPALFFGLLSAWLVARAVRTDRRSDWLGAAFLAALAFYAHYSGMLVPAFEGAYLLLAARRPRALTAGAMLALLCVPGVILYLAPSFLSPTTYSYWQEFFGPGVAAKMADRLFGIPVSPGDPLPVKAIGGALLLVALLLPAWAVLRGIRREERGSRRPLLFAATYFAVPVALFAAASCLRPLWHDRYVLVAAPAFFLLLGWSLSELRGHARTALVVSLLGLYALSIGRPSRLWAKEDWRAAAAAVQQAGAGLSPVQGEVLLTYDYVQIGFDHYYSGELPRVGFPQRGKKLEVLAHEAAGKHAVFVVHEDHHDGDRDLRLVRLLLAEYGSGRLRRFTGVRVFAFGRRADALGGVPLTPAVLAGAETPYRR